MTTWTHLTDAESRSLARYGRLLVAAVDRGELDPVEVYRRGRAVGERFMARHPSGASR